MIYEVKQPISGFDNIEKVILEKHDELTTVMTCHSNNDIKITLVNTAKNRKYFEIPIGIQTLLDINDYTNYSVYFTVILEKNIKNSLINLGAPIIFNEDNKTVAQCIISNDTITLQELDYLNITALETGLKTDLRISTLISQKDSKR